MLFGQIYGFYKTILVVQQRKKNQQDISFALKRRNTYIKDNLMDEITYMTSW